MTSNRCTCCCGLGVLYLIGQLLRGIQSKAEAFYSDKKGESTISELNARLLLAIKRLLNERGMSPDVGCQDQDKINDMARQWAIPLFKGDLTLF